METNKHSRTNLAVRKQICDLLNISRTTLWRIERLDPSFPRPINLHISKAQWHVEEVIAWAKSTRSPIHEEYESSRLISLNQ